jgi:hypothetical protein
MFSTTFIFLENTKKGSWDVRNGILEVKKGRVFWLLSSLGVWLYIAWVVGERSRHMAVFQELDTRSTGLCKPFLTF